MKKTTKKLVSLGLAAVMAASLTACGGKSDNGATTAATAETTAAADAGAATRLQEVPLRSAESDRLPEELLFTDRPL